jgi:hypothetical protein
VDIHGRNNLWAALEDPARRIERWYQGQGVEVLLRQPELLCADIDLTKTNPHSDIYLALRNSGYEPSASPDRGYMVYLAGWESTVAGHGGMGVAVVGEQWYEYHTADGDKRDIADAVLAHEIGHLLYGPDHAEPSSPPRLMQLGAVPLSRCVL